MAKDQHEIADSLATEMRQVFEAAENNMLVISNIELTKDSSLAEKKQAIINKSLSVAKIVDQQIAKTTNSPKFKKETRKFTGLMLNQATKEALKKAKKINRLRSVDEIKKSIYEQTQKGINEGIKIQTKRGKIGYKEYMEMKVRSNIQSEISERQLQIGAKAKVVFYIVNEFADCADDHAEYQGKIYYDERWQTFGFTPEAEQKIAKRILDKRMLSIQQVRNKAPYLTTRPNCRHSFKPIPIDTALNVDSKKILKDNKWSTGSYKSSNYKATQQQRTNERQIRFHKAKAEVNMKMYEKTKDVRFLNQARRSKMIYTKYKNKQIKLVKDNPDLQRDYRRESTKILVNDLGVKYNMPKEEKVVLNIDNKDVILGDKKIYNDFVNTGTYDKKRIDEANVRMNNVDSKNKVLRREAMKMEEIVANASQEELDSTRGYLNKDYLTMNKVLRGFTLNEGDSLTETQANIYIRNVSSMLNRAKLSEDVVVHRFLDSSALKRLFKFTKEDFKSLKNGDYDLVKNKTFVEKGFMSTTFNKIAPGFFREDDLEMEIFVPKGARAMYVAKERESLGATTHEEELLIDKGYEFRITKFEAKGKNAFDETKYKVTMELIHLEEEDNE